MRAKFIRSSLVSALAGDEAQQRSFSNRFPSSSRCLFLLLVIVLVLSAPLSTLAKETSVVELTPEEQAWLVEHPVIVLGIPTTYPPVVIKTSNNIYVGMAVDLFEEISQRLNTKIHLHIEDSWSDIQEKAKNREIDGLALGGKHSSRAALYNSTDLVLPTYRSGFARSQNEYQLKKFSDLDGMRIGYKRAGRPTSTL